MRRPPHVARQARLASLGALLGLCVARSGLLAAQALSVGAYYENTAQLDYTSEANAEFLDASKIRLDAGLGLAPGLEFGGNVNLIVSLGDIHRRLGPYLPDEIASALQALGLVDTFSLDRARFFVDNALLTWSAGPARVRLGKQQLSWGPAYGFNPTDLFHRKNLLDPTYEKEGVVAVRGDLRWGVGGQFSAIVARREDLSELGYALRLGTHISSLGYDVAATLHQVDDSTGLDPTTLAPRSQRRRAAGLEVSGELLGLGVWLEGNYNQMALEDDFVRLAGGLDYTLRDGTYLMVEALYSGRSETRTPYPMHDWLANVMYGEPVGLGWLMLGVRRDVSDLTKGSVYAFVSPDGSLVVNPRVDVSLAQDLDLVVFAGLTAGNEDGAFPPGLYSVVARATAYF